MSAFALKLYGILVNEKTSTLDLDITKVLILKEKGVNVLKILYRKSFFYHFYKVFTAPA